MTPLYVPVGEFNWTAVGAWGGFFALIGIIARQVGPWRKQSMDAEKGFRDDLLVRVEKLELMLEKERARHELERAIDRHRINNITQCFDAMMMMLKAAPEKVADIIQHIEKMRADQIKAEALEKTGLAALLVAQTEQ